MSGVDLHVHSTASDGRLTPEGLVRRAAELGMTHIALTDHDSVNGIAAALSAAETFSQLTVIPGVEISTDVPGAEVHMLGYCLDYTDQRLLSALKKMRLSRQERARGMVTKLNNMGLSLDWQRIEDIARDSTIGRPHIAQALQERGYISSFREAFTKYIGRDGPAYVERSKMTPAEAMALIVQAGGLPVLAHPLFLKEPEAMTRELKMAGLIGIEAYYNGYTEDEVNRLVSLADRYELVATGGSDYHGLDDNMETMLGGAKVPLASAEKLMKLVERKDMNPSGS